MNMNYVITQYTYTDEYTPSGRRKWTSDTKRKNNHDTLFCLIFYETYMWRYWITNKRALYKFVKEYSDGSVKEIYVVTIEICDDELLGVMYISITYTESRGYEFMIFKYPTLFLNALCERYSKYHFSVIYDFAECSPQYNFIRLIYTEENIKKLFNACLFDIPKKDIHRREG